MMISTLRHCSFPFAGYLRLRTAIVLLCFVYAQIDKTVALGQFRNGRYDHGFLGEPSKVEILRRKPEPEDRWFEQKLDHFNGQSNAVDVTWKQRFFMNDEHYRNDSTAPIFLMIGGESEASKRWMSEGAWIKYAEHFGALCFQLEHRFYGRSHPTSDLSTKNLVYLTSEQALADLANFIKAMKKQFNLVDTQKWIVFGGSYPGSLAAWAREKYPELIHGAISSSGPLLAKVDFKEYFEVVKTSLVTHSDACVEAVGRAFAQVEILTRHMIGQRNLDEKFKTCTPIKDSVENALDMSNFFENLASNFAGVVQYNKDNSPHASYTIDDLCNVMVNSTIGPPVARLGIVNDMLLKETNETCLDYKYDKMIAEMKESSWESKAANGSRQWTYQTCNEFGFYQTSNNKSDTFGDRFNINFFIRQCMDIYSENMDDKYLEQVVSQTNKVYGALQPNTTNVLFVHGSIDPWHALGLTRSKNPKLPTIYIEGTAHCANMYEPVKTDPPQLVAARNKIIKYIAQLLDNFTFQKA